MARGTPSGPQAAGRHAGMRTGRPGASSSGPAGHALLKTAVVGGADLPASGPAQTPSAVAAPPLVAGPAQTTPPRRAATAGSGASSGVGGSKPTLPGKAVGVTNRTAAVFRLLRNHLIRGILEALWSATAEGAVAATKAQYFKMHERLQWVLTGTVSDKEEEDAELDWRADTAGRTTLSFENFARAWLLLGLASAPGGDEQAIVNVLVALRDKLVCQDLDGSWKWLSPVSTQQILSTPRVEVVEQPALAVSPQPAANATVLSPRARSPIHANIGSARGTPKASSSRQFLGPMPDDEPTTTEPLLLSGVAVPASPRRSGLSSTLPGNSSPTNLDSPTAFSWMLPGMDAEAWMAAMHSAGSSVVGSEHLSYHDADGISPSPALFIARSARLQPRKGSVASTKLNPTPRAAPVAQPSLTEPSVGPRPASAHPTVQPIGSATSVYVSVTGTRAFDKEAQETQRRALLARGRLRKSLPNIQHIQDAKHGAEQLGILSSSYSTPLLTQHLIPNGRAIPHTIPAVEIIPQPSIAAPEPLTVVAGVRVPRPVGGAIPEPTGSYAAMYASSVKGKRGTLSVTVPLDLEVPEDEEPELRGIAGISVAFQRRKAVTFGRPTSRSSPTSNNTSPSPTSRSHAGYSVVLETQDAAFPETTIDDDVFLVQGNKPGPVAVKRRPQIPALPISDAVVPEVMPIRGAAKSKPTVPPVFKKPSTHQPMSNSQTVSIPQATSSIVPPPSRLHRPLRKSASITSADGGLEGLTPWAHTPRSLMTAMTPVTGSRLGAQPSERLMHSYSQPVGVTHSTLT